MNDSTLAIDFGTTWTAAAFAQNGNVRRIDFSGETRLPSLIWIDEDGAIQVGEAALNQFAMAPNRLQAEPKALLGRVKTVPIAGQRHEVADLVGAVLARVHDEATQRYGRPAKVRLTHPAGWGQARKEALIESARRAGIEDPTLVSEPEAAALWLAEKLSPGQRLAVYDLGGGTFDTAVLERTETGFKLIGSPGGDDELGGERFDDRLLGHVGKQVGEEHPEAWEHLQKRDSATWTKRAADLRLDVRKAKEALSHAERFNLSVPVGDEEQPLMVMRQELEELVMGDVERSYELLGQTIAGAGLSAGDLQGVYLTGGSSELRLVRDLGQQAYDQKLRSSEDPKALVALGAAGMKDAETGPVVAPPPPPEPELKPPEPPPAPPPTPGPEPSGDRIERKPFPIWQLVLAVAGLLGVVQAFMSPTDFKPSALTGITDLLLYGGLLVAAVVSAIRRKEEVGLACGLLAAGAFGWSVVGLSPVDAQLADYSLATKDWLTTVLAWLALAGALGLTLGDRAVRRQSWAVINSPRDAWTIMAAAGGALVFAALFLPYQGIGGTDFNVWKGFTGIYDVIYAVLGAAVAVVGLSTWLSPRRGLVWLLSLLGAALLGFVWTPSDFASPGVDLLVGYWLIYLGGLAACVGGIAAWFTARRGNPKIQAAPGE